MSFEILGVTKRFGDLAVLDGFGCTLHGGLVTAMLGPSGCGKTTLLKILSGLLDADAGDLGGIEHLRPVAIFQEPRLLPWRTVYENLSVVVPPGDEEAGRRRIYRLLSLVNLTPFSRYRPGELSGGMRQRVSLVRGFTVDADILLMDEPFQALDLRLKRELIGVFRTLRREDPRTTVLVTHSVDEAVLLGDRILVLSERPMRVIAELSNPADQERRVLGSGELAGLETELYRLLLS